MSEDEKDIIRLLDAVSNNMELFQVRLTDQQNVILQNRREIEKLKLQVALLTDKQINN